MGDRLPLPDEIGGVAVPQDAESAATWAWAQHALPLYLMRHSVRSYCWGVAIARHDRLPFDARILWSAALMHDVGLTRIRSARACFEYEGADIARRFLRGAGMVPSDVERVAKAIVDHMAPGVTLADGAESVLLDRATGLDVRGVDYELSDPIRAAVMAAFPRGSFDHWFLAAISREVAARPGCESERLLKTTGLAEWMARSPWRTGLSRVAGAPRPRSGSAGGSRRV